MGLAEIVLLIVGALLALVGMFGVLTFLMSLSYVRNDTAPLVISVFFLAVGALGVWFITVAL